MNFHGFNEIPDELNVRRDKTWRKIVLKKMRSNPFIISFRKVEDSA